MNQNLGKFAKDLLRQAQQAFKDDAAYYKRRAKGYRQLAATVKLLGPMLNNLFNPKPIKFPKLTKAQRRAMGGYPDGVAIAIPARARKAG